MSMQPPGPKGPRAQGPTPDQDPKRKWILLALPFCAVMGLFEFNRALSGNHLSWVYVFEWPFFAIFVLYMYMKLSQPQEPYDDSNDPKREIE